MKRAKKWPLAFGIIIIVCLAVYLAFPFFVNPPLETRTRVGSGAVSLRTGLPMMFR